MRDIATWEDFEELINDQPAPVLPTTGSLKCDLWWTGADYGPVGYYANLLGWQVAFLVRRESDCKAGMSTLVWELWGTGEEVEMPMPHTIEALNKLGPEQLVGATLHGVTHFSDALSPQDVAELIDRPLFLLDPPADKAVEVIPHFDVKGMSSGFFTSLGRAGAYLDKHLKVHWKQERWQDSGVLLDLLTLFNFSRYFDLPGSQDFLPWATPLLEETLDAA